MLAHTHDQDSRLTPPEPPYVAWLRAQGIPLYRSQHGYWKVYNQALVPATIGPSFLNVTEEQGKALLWDSEASLLRYSSNPREDESDWYYIVCDSFDPKRIAPKIRQNLKRASRGCSVRRIEAYWLAINGYPCYRAAYARYTNATPETENRFRENILATVDGPFEYWGVFVGDYLAGYCQCVLDENHVNTNVTKYDPAYLKLRTAYALVHAIIDHYVAQLGMTVNNGNRQVAHDTKYQEFLLSLGFRKLFCHLHVIYQPWLKTAVEIAFPFRSLISKLPQRGSIHRVQALLFQEGLRRQCG